MSAYSLEAHVLLRAEVLRWYFSLESVKVLMASIFCQSVSLDFKILSTAAPISLLSVSLMVPVLCLPTSTPRYNLYVSSHFRAVMVSSPYVGWKGST